MADESLVSLVCDFTGLNYELDRPMVLAALRAKHNNHEAVVSEFFDDPSKFRSSYGWDETPFLSERDGSLPRPNVPSFSIQSPDESAVIHGVPASVSVPPSRPPSRVNNRSPLGAPSTRAEEEADFQRALAESAAESGLSAPPPQETGITSTTASSGGDTTLPFFGPAVRDHYDQSQWAVVPVKREKPDPQPSYRKREQGKPAFLRCRKTDASRHRIGSLLTIFHEIPLARNIFLEVGTPTEAYGINPQWWKGDPIVPAELQASQPNPEQAMWDASVPPPEPDFAHELHRLMAVLDITDRAYLTADSLANLRAIADAWGPTSTEGYFFIALKAPGLVEHVAPLMWEVEVMPFYPSQFPETYRETDQFGQFELRFDKFRYESIQSLYDAWDELFWIDYHSSESDEGLRTAAITAAGDVLTIALAGDGLSHPIDIPGVFYIDRYMAEHKDRTMDQQLKLRDLRRRLQEAEVAKHEAGLWEDPDNGNKLSIRKMCETKIEEYTHKDRWLRDDALWRQWWEKKFTPDWFIFLPGPWSDHVIRLTKEEEEKSASYLHMIGVMQRELDDMEKRVQECQDRIDQIKADIRELTRQHTVPSAEDGWNPTRKYTLRGVATSDDTVYIARRAEQNLIEMDGVPAPSDQWWKMSYISADDVNPVRVTMTTLEEAVKAACTETKTPILVYANDNALDAMPKVLSDALHTFVKFDNRYFKQELIEQRPERPAPPPPPPPPPGPPPTTELPPIAAPLPMPSDGIGFSSSDVGSARLVRTSSTEVSIGSRSSDTAMADDDDQDRRDRRASSMMDDGGAGTEMAEMMLVDHPALTPSSSASTANIHTPSTLTDPSDQADEGPPTTTTTTTTTLAPASSSVGVPPAAASVASATAAPAPPPPPRPVSSGDAAPTPTWNNPDGGVSSSQTD